MTRLAAVLAAMGVAAAIAVCPPAAADPEDLVPICSGEQTPMNADCRVAPAQVSDQDSGLGTNPDIPAGTGSGEPFVVGLGEGGEG